MYMDNTTYYIVDESEGIEYGPYESYDDAEDAMENVWLSMYAPEIEER